MVVFLLGVIIFILRNSSVLPYNNFTIYAMPFGSAIETVLLSFTLANKITILKKEKEESQAKELLASQENEKILAEQNAILEYKVNERTSELNIKALKAQMNPHFLSNCMAAIQNLIYKNNIEKAGYYLAKFSLFMRQILNYSDKTFITLAEEIDMIKLEMELEELRFNSDVDFTISVSDNIVITKCLIPALITQPFIENAIWHGLLPLAGIREPRLKVDIRRIENEIRIEIVDNGIGRKKESIKLNKNSKGTTLIEDRLKSLNILYPQAKLSLELIDLKNNLEQPMGTKVLITYREIFE